MANAIKQKINDYFSEPTHTHDKKKCNPNTEYSLQNVQDLSGVDKEKHKLKFITLSHNPLIRNISHESQFTNVRYTHHI